jgi:hypothetical protein
MNLGAILAQSPGIPIIDWPVEFHFTKPGTKEQVLISAFLLPVSEAERARSRNEALHFLKTNAASPFYRVFQEEKEAEGQRRGYKEPFEIPKADFNLEQEYKFMSYALYTKDENGSLSKLIKNDADYTLFREGIVLSVLEYLYVRHNALIEQEYPEILPQKTKQELEEDALKK